MTHSRLATPVFLIGLIVLVCPLGLASAGQAETSDDKAADAPTERAPADPADGASAAPSNDTSAEPTAPAAKVPSKPAVESVKGSDSEEGNDDVHALLERGDVSTLVADIQRTLNVRHADILDNPLLVDGYFGPKTEEAVRKFQADNADLDVTGKVDDRTFMALEPFVPRSPVLQWIMVRVNDVLEEKFDGGRTVKHVTAFVACLLIALVAAATYYVARNWVETLRDFLVPTRSSSWGAALADQQFFRRLTLLVPGFVIYVSSLIFASKSAFQPIGTASDGVQLFSPPAAPVMLPYFDIFEGWYVAVQRFGLAYMVVAGLLIGESFLRSCRQVYSLHDTHGSNPVKALIQASRLVLYLLAAILLFSAFSGKNPTVIVAGLGAFMAVLMLIFKDSILGLVASVHIITNDLVKIGDWIEMPKFDADGDVVDITLGTVKVQNFDKTVTTIPTYSILSESFKNWTDMHQAGGRRIKRSINIDMRSIKVCSPEMIAHFEKMELLTDYVRQKTEELDQYNKEHDAEASPVNSRRLTNVGTFRHYVVAYLQNHPSLRKDMTLLVRQLQPTKEGLPLQIYVFTNDTNWGIYESVQADIFDHLLASLPAFELRAFQNISDAVTLDATARRGDLDEGSQTKAVRQAVKKSTRRTRQQTAEE